MALGRYRRNRSKVARANYRKKGKATRGPSINTWVGRTSGGKYTAYACLGMGGAKVKKAGHGRCSRYLQQGRTPQSAIAKALKSLSQVIARRGR